MALWGGVGFAAKVRRSVRQCNCRPPLDPNPPNVDRVRQYPRRKFKPREKRGVGKYGRHMDRPRRRGGRMEPTPHACEGADRDALQHVSKPRAAAVAPRPSSTTTTTTMTGMTSEGSRTLLEIQDHARLIDHHAAHTSGGAGTGSFSGSATARAPAAGLWTAPEPAHGVRGGDTSAQWTNPASWPEQRDDENAMLIIHGQGTHLHMHGEMADTIGKSKEKCTEKDVSGYQLPNWNSEEASRTVKQKRASADPTSLKTHKQGERNLRELHMFWSSQHSAVILFFLPLSLSEPAAPATNSSGA
ncbi:hypothetical protein L1887_57881 [Cichorium endivia]|nr:hypothetical protein L1887_57881 [Cichorium endivia]